MRLPSLTRTTSDLRPSRRRDAHDSDVLPLTCHAASPFVRALHWATLNGDIEACEVLIEAGSRLDRKNKLKESILDYAIKYENVKLKVKYEGLMK